MIKPDWYQAIAREDRNERKALYSQIQALVLDDAYHVFIHTDADVKVMTKAVRGFAPSLDTLIRLPRLWKER